MNEFQSSTEMGLQNYQTITLDDPNLKTRLITIHIDDNDAQNYIVLNAHNQTVWRLTEDVESTSTAIVLGAREVGSDGAAVIGLPHDRVGFTTPDLRAVNDVKLISRTLCSRTYNPMQWFGEYLDGRISFHPKPTQPRQRLGDVQQL